MSRLFATVRAATRVARGYATVPISGEPGRFSTGLDKSAFLVNDAQKALENAEYASQLGVKGRSRDSNSGGGTV